MPTVPLPLEAVYCEGWDPASAAPVGPLEAVTARARNEAGEQYAVLVRTPDAVPLVLLEISWADHHCGIWLFDAEGRCHTHHSYARADGDGGLLLSRGFQWSQPPLGAMPDRLHDWTLRVEALDRGRGLYRYETQRDGGLFSVNRTLDPELARVAALPVPPFGDWAALLRAHPDLADGELQISEAAVEAGGVPVEAPWTPPRPHAPRRVNDLFRPGGRFTTSWHPEVGTVLVRDIGTVNLPTGRVLVYGSGSLCFAKDTEAFTVSLPAGEHPVRLSLLRFGQDDEEAACVTALRVDVQDPEQVPVASWEMALRPGQDPRDLPEDHFYGVGVDGGQVGITDAACLPRFAELFDDFRAYERAFFGLPERELRDIRDRERRWQDTARELIDRPEGRPAVRRAFMEAIGLSPDDERYEKYNNNHNLLRLAHAVAGTTDPDLSALDDPAQRAERTSCTDLTGW
ncbi:DUF4241 domain-containing protein [Nocardiopsis synnemataformans]|uniref:DUF4241 domain-containing protein n=1 Tax=Nocardiopsis synnemataformans TaxID=61305 RepID=UPI003EB70F43